MSADLLTDYNNDNDLVIGSNGDLQLTSSTAELVASRLADRIGTALGEWFLELTYGFDWFGLVFGVKNPQRVDIETEFRRLIVTTPDVVRLLDLDVNLDFVQRAMSVRFEVEVPGATVVVEVSSADFFGYTIVTTFFPLSSIA